MVYGNQSVRMAGKKAPPAPADAGDAPFRKAGPETARLHQLMEEKGIMYNDVMSMSVIAEDPWFVQFKPNSLKANITAMKKIFNMRENVESLQRTFLLIVASNLTILTTGIAKGGDDDEDGDIFDDKKVAAVAKAPPVVPAAAKRAAAASIPTITPAKKPTPEAKFMVSGVVTQALYTDDQKRDRLVVVVTMPANVTDANQLTVFCPASNGAKLILGVPRGVLANNMEKLMKGIASMPGFSRIDAWSASNALENALKCRRVRIDEVIIDNFVITLDKTVDPTKLPDLHVFKSQDDGDIGSITTP
jgi:hypothetical protein